MAGKIPVLLTRISSYPISEPVDFGVSLDGATPDTRHFLIKLTRLRNIFLRAIKIGDADQICKTATEYLPHLDILSNLIKKETKSRGPLSFTWTSGMESELGLKYKYYSYFSEVLMAGVTYCYANINLASDLRKKEPDNLKSQCFALLRAASHLTCLCNHWIPKWKTIPKSRPVEFEASFLMALSKFCLASAHAVHFKSAEVQLKEGLAGYARNIRLFMEEGLQLIENDKLQLRIERDYWALFTFQERVYYAGENYLFALYVKDTFDPRTKSLTHGDACRISQEAFDTMELISKHEDKSSLGIFSNFKGDVIQFKNECDALFQLCQKESISVYIDQIVPKELPENTKRSGVFSEKNIEKHTYPPIDTISLQFE